jgi:hypothetical protein
MSPYIIRVIKSRGVKWAGRAARMGEIGNTYRILVRNLKEGDQSEDLGIDWRRLLVWISQK